MSESKPPEQFGTFHMHDIALARERLVSAEALHSLALERMESLRLRLCMHYGLTEGDTFSWDTGIITRKPAPEPAVAPAVALVPAP